VEVDFDYLKASGTQLSTHIPNLVQISLCGQENEIPGGGHRWLHATSGYSSDQNLPLRTYSAPTCQILAQLDNPQLSYLNSSVTISTMGTIRHLRCDWSRFWSFSCLWNPILYQFIEYGTDICSRDIPKHKISQWWPIMACFCFWF